MAESRYPVTKKLNDIIESIMPGYRYDWYTETLYNDSGGFYVPLGSTIVSVEGDGIHFEGPSYD